MENTGRRYTHEQIIPILNSSSTLGVGRANFGIVTARSCGDRSATAREM
jgi:hypothetical protein